VDRARIQARGRRRRVVDGDRGGASPRGAVVIDHRDADAVVIEGGAGGIVVRVLVSRTEAPDTAAQIGQVSVGERGAALGRLAWRAAAPGDGHRVHVEYVRVAERAGQGGGAILVDRRGRQTGHDRAEVLGEEVLAPGAALVGDTNTVVASDERRVLDELVP